MPAKPTTIAARARELHAAEPDLSTVEIARRLSTPRRTIAVQHVQRSLAAAGRSVGRPPVSTGTVELRIRLEADIVARARAQAERDDYSLAEWLEGCLIAGVEDAEFGQAARAKMRRRAG